MATSFFFVFFFVVSVDWNVLVQSLLMHVKADPILRIY
jgi:hypothetical protein